MILPSKPAPCRRMSRVDETLSARRNTVVTRSRKEKPKNRTSAARTSHQQGENPEHDAYGEQEIQNERGDGNDEHGDNGDNPDPHQDIGLLHPAQVIAQQRPRVPSAIILYLVRSNSQHGIRFPVQLGVDQVTA